MHFGRSIFFSTSGDVLTVISPSDPLMIAGIFMMSLIFWSGFAFKGQGRKIVPWVCNILGTSLLLSMVTSSAKVVLDGPHSKVHVTTVLFFRPTHYEYSLAEIQGAVVGESDQADALRLVFNGGSSLQLTPYNQQHGKGEAAFAINKFIQEHGGAGRPY